MICQLIPVGKISLIFCILVLKITDLKAFVNKTGSSKDTADSLQHKHTEHTVSI